MKIKIIQVKGKTPEERKNLIEQTQNLNDLIQCRGSTYFEYNNLFYADIYFILGQTPIKEVTQENKVAEVYSNSPSFKTGQTGSPDSKSKPFKPTEEMLERWKTIKPTFKTKGLLMKKGYSNEEIKQIKTMYDAHIVLNNLKEENI